MDNADFEYGDLDEDRGIEVLFSAREIRLRVQTLAERLANQHKSDLLVIAILKGSFVFASDLIRALHDAGMSPEVDFIFLASYHGGKQSQGHVKVLRDIGTDVKGRDVLIVDDILESGRTLAFARGLIAGRGAASVSTCVLLDKPVERAREIEADHIGFTAPKVFVVGYGMDLDNRYRELPYIGRLLEN